ncbi:LOW QUALITY PROTEIN: reverse transcriptase [Phytophthora megakarya]|uniref:Reverse transcriptase n=1 Tax=Phytophthora megakarya TaxID=4795 RepID=A0A225WP32_9STRA|nr:LOW QUALITY PROTEIN: reverse transcriptase [Phytophthora megakarya]
MSSQGIRATLKIAKSVQLFEILKRNIVANPVVRHPDRPKPFIIILHANQWIACPVLGQKHDVLIQSVLFTERVLHIAELRYHITEKKSLLVVPVFKTHAQGCPLILYSCHKEFKWIMKSKTADGMSVPCGVLLSQWNLDIRKIHRDEDGLAGILGAGINPREHLDEIAEGIASAKGHAIPPLVVCFEMLMDTLNVSRRILKLWMYFWELTGGKILDAYDFILEDITGNDAGIGGLLND